jgi:hypothetical protein
MIAFASVYAALDLTKSALKTLHGTHWWAAKQLNQFHLKGAS